MHLQPGDIVTIDFPGVKGISVGQPLWFPLPCIIVTAQM